MVDIKSNEKPERATTGNKKQPKATKSKKSKNRTLKLEKPKRVITNQNELQRAKKSKWKQGFKLMFPSEKRRKFFNEFIHRMINRDICIMLFNLRLRDKI